MRKDGTIKRADGKIINNSGCMATAVPQSANTFSSSRSKLPPKVDLRPMLTPIEDQGQVGSCTANAVAGAYEYLVKANQGINYDASRLFIYYNARAAAKPKKMADNGSNIFLAVESLSKLGVCSENTWKYSENQKYVNSKPSQEAYEEAEEFKVTDFDQVPLDLNVWKQALADGYPIVFGAYLFNSFYNQRRPGLVSMPSANEQKLQRHGAHAMLCVGYSDADQVFIVRNSWGTKWGDHGYCYMPYKYLISPTLNCCKAGMVIYAADPVPMPEKHWDNDDESVIPDIETAFSEMDEATWNEMCYECGDYDIIYRIGGLYVAASVMDEDFSDKEKAEAARRLQKITNYFGVKMNAKKVIENCLELACDEEFLTSTMVIFAKYLNESLKLTILNDMIEITSSDGMDTEEEGFIRDMAEIFNIEEDTEAQEIEDILDEDWFDDDEDESYEDDCNEEEYPSISEALAEISEKEWDKIAKKMGDHDMIERMVHLMMVAFNNDDADEDAYSNAVNEICECCYVDTNEYIQSVSEDIDYLETLKLFGKYLPENLKAAIAGAVGAIIEDSEEELAEQLADIINEWFE